MWAGSTYAGARTASSASSIGLFVLAAAATLTIFIRDPLVAWGYALGIFLLAGYGSFLEIRTPNWGQGSVVGVSVAVISLWGFAQLAAGATVFRYATWDAALRTMALGATAWVAANELRDPGRRLRFLTAFAWFAFALSAVSVVAYFTSPGHVLWFFSSPYPDVWGPFLSRNDFAGFLELSLPVALWLSAEARFPLWVPAWMLAAGLASGSRARRGPFARGSRTHHGVDFAAAGDRAVRACLAALLAMVAGAWARCRDASPGKGSIPLPP